VAHGVDAATVLEALHPVSLYLEVGDPKEDLPQHRRKHDPSMREAGSVLRWEVGTYDPPTPQFTSPEEGSFLLPGILSFEQSLVQVDAVAPSPPEIVSSKSM
jgi:hypothetical protein